MYSWLLFINSKRTQRKTSKGNKVHEAGPRRPGTSSQGFLLMKSVPPVIYCDNTCEMSPRGAQGDTAPRVFTSGWSYRHICPVVQAHLPTRFQALGEEQMLSTNHTVYTNSLSTGSHSFL